MMGTLRIGEKHVGVTGVSGRLAYWDIAKGMVILLVILGHLPQTPAWLKQWIYTFHMPFFFIANAFFIKHYKFKVHMKNSFKSLLVPYMIVCVIEAFCYAIRRNTDVYYAYDILRVNGQVISGSDMNFWNIFWDKIADMFVGISFTSYRFKEFESVWIVWFLVCLFAAKMMYIGIRKIFSTWTSLGIVIVLSGAGMMIGQGIAFFPWSFDVALVCLPFMWVGEYLRKSNLLEHKYRKFLFVICFVFWILLSVFEIRGELAMRIYVGYGWCIVNAVLGSMVMIWSAKYLEAKKGFLVDVLSWCGKNSIIILGIHCLEHRFFDWNAWGYDRLSVDLHWSILFFIHAAAIVGSAWVVVECKRRVELLTRQKTNYVNV